jgi:hypothetical protein
VCGVLLFFFSPRETARARSAMGADTACTIRVRKFLTNRLLGRKQFVSFRASPRLRFLRFGVVLVQHGLRCLVLPVRVSACCGWGRRGGHTARFRRKQLATYRGDWGGAGPKMATRICRGGVSGKLEIPQPGLGGAGASMPCAYCNAQNQCLSSGNMRGKVRAVGGQLCTGARIPSVARGWRFQLLTHCSRVQ